MSKMSTDRQILHGATMGTRWSAIVHTSKSVSEAALGARLQAAVDQVDREMSTWKPASDLNRINAAAPGVWVEIPQDLFHILRLSLELNAVTEGAFDITLGRQVGYWGFGALARRANDRVAACREPDFAFTLPAIELDAVNRRVRKHMDVALDLSGIAKGFGVDRLAETAKEMNIDAGLFSIDGELRALGSKPDGSGWAIGIEAPDPCMRTAESVIELTDAAVATSGTYRHFRALDGRTVHHTIDPGTGAPSASGIVSASVIAQTAAMADALATALLISGASLAEDLARDLQIGYRLIDQAGGSFTNLHEA